VSFRPAWPNCSTTNNYTVNNAGRIRTLTIGSTLRATWTYDGFQKLRIKAATSPAATMHYIWDSFGHIIAEHNATGGAALKQYIWLGDTPLAVFDNTTLYYVHPDHLDRPVVMTNASAQTIAWQAKYDPFGVPVAVTVSPVNNQRLPGQWFQSEDGLAYNWHRTYDPTLGRYTQADPLGFVDGPGIYNYAGGSPMMKVDPSGQYAFLIRALVGAGTGIFFEYLLNGDCAGWQDYASAAAMGAVFGQYGSFRIKGGEIVGNGKIWRFAPFGNRGGNKYGKWPHYHRRGNGDGQGIGRHRPWEPRVADKSWWDRF
jgi:RHS repeat-associated protein